jgi:hypothetical protein
MAVDVPSLCSPDWFGCDHVHGSCSLYFFKRYCLDLIDYRSAAVEPNVDESVTPPSDISISTVNEAPKGKVSCSNWDELVVGVCSRRLR